MKSFHILLLLIAGLLPLSAAAVITPVPQGQIYTPVNGTPVAVGATFTLTHPHKAVNDYDIMRKAVLTFGVDHQYPQSYAAGLHKVKLLVRRYNDSSSGTYTDTTVFMEINYSPTATSFEDEHMIQVNGMEKYTVTLQEIYLNNVLVTNLQSNLYIHGDLYIDRITDFTPYVNSVSTISSSAIDLDCGPGNTKDELVISWGAITGAEEYQLEWTYVSNYPSSSTALPLSASAVWVDFKTNSTRITTTSRSYAITLAFDKGYICYRVRAVGRNTADINKKIFGKWNSALESGYVSTMNYYEQTTAYEGGKNWQYSGTYAEEGKKKEVVSFFDGTLRNRQMVTKVNSDNNTIVGETIYDHMGRPAIQVLPTPVADPECGSTDESALRYYKDFTTNNAGKAYNRNNFDVDTTGNPCKSNIEGMSDATGASNYYSENNPDQSGSQEFLPDANKFPFSQVEYMPDNTGRIRRQGGVGEEFQLNSGHESKYFYSHPSQTELDRMFGSEVGDYAHYQKNMVIDPNGQVSVSYLDQEGRVIATSLAGDSPTNVTALTSAGASAVTITDNLLIVTNGASNANQLTTDGNTLLFSEKISLSAASNVTFYYDMKVGALKDDCLNDNICLNCVYDLTLRITDDCGTDYLGTSLRNKTTGSFTVNPSGDLVFLTTCDTLQYDTTVTVNLPLGTYQVTKELTVNQEAKDFYVDYYLKPANNECIKTLEDFVTEFLSYVDFEDCEPKDCADCLEHLGTLEDFVAAGYGSAQDYQLVYDQCIEPCKQPSYCETMKQIMMTDVSPHGQYGQYEIAGGTVQPTSFPLSVFNWSNSLPQSFGSSVIPGNSGDWQHPRIYNADGSETYLYLNADGTRSKVQVQPAFNLLTGAITATTPATNDFTPAWVFQENGQWYTFPENLTNVGDFIIAWKPSWAQSLLFYHPEFSYIRSCLEFTVEAESGDEYTSESFDAEMALCDSWNMALSYGFVSTPGSSSTPIEDRIGDFGNQSSTLPWDPYWAKASHYGLTSSEIADMVYEYKNIWGTDYSMMEIAALIVRCDGGTGYSSLPDPECIQFGLHPETRDEEWRVFKSLYYGAKQEKLMKLFKNRAMSNTDPEFQGYNGCIGNPSFNPFTDHFAELLFTPFPPYMYFFGQYFNDFQPCYWNTRELYKTKQRRFADPVEMFPVDMNSAAFQQFQLTGECTQTSLFGTLLDQIVVDGNLNDASFGLNPYPAFGAFYSAMSIGTPVPVPAATWTQTTSNSTTLSTDFISGSTTIGSVSLSKLPGEPVSFGWNDVFNTGSIHYTGDATGGVNFTIELSVHTTGPADAVVTVNGFTTFDLAMCGFYEGGTAEVPVTCTVNELGYDIANLVRSLALSGDLDATSAVQVKGSSAPLEIMVTDQLEMAAEGSVAETNFFWKFDSGNQRFELYHSGSDPRLQLTIVSTTPGTFTSANFGTIASVIEVEALGGNELDIKCYDVSAAYLGTIRCAVSSVAGSVVTPKNVGSCDSADENCAGIAFDNYEELPALLEDIIENQTAGSYDLFASGFMTPGLASQIDPDGDMSSGGSDVTTNPTPGNTSETVGPIFMSTEEPVLLLNGPLAGCNCRIELSYVVNRYFSVVGNVRTTYVDSTILHIQYCAAPPGSPLSCPAESLTSEEKFTTYVLVDTIDIITETTDLDTNDCFKLWVEGPATNPLSLEDVTDVYGFGVMGEPDGQGNYHEFYMFGVFGSGISAITDTIYGFVCMPIQKCCDPFDFMTISRTQALTISNRQFNAGMLISEMNHDLCTEQYLIYTSKIGSFNSSPWAVAHSQTLTSGFASESAFLASGKCYCTQDYITLINTYISASSSASMPPMPTLSDFEGCEELEGDGSPCGDSYLDYLISAYDYNAWAELNNKVQLPFLLSENAFMDSMACNCVSDYNDYLDAIQAGEIIIGYAEAVREILSFCRIMETTPCTPDPLFPIEPMPEVPFLDPCAEFLTSVAYENAVNAYEEYINEMTADIANRYTEHCLGSVKEVLTKSYQNKEYHFTLYYYDQAGNLIKTVPPEGVTMLPITSYNDATAIDIRNDRLNNTHKVTTSHRLASVYQYNSLNQLVRQSVPDQDPLDLWEKILPNGLPSKLNTTAIQMVSTNVGYLSGYISYAAAPYTTRGYLFRTENGGINWTKVHNTIGAKLNKVQMMTGGLIGYAVGESGVALKTLDGGNSWDLLNTYASGIAAEITDLYFSTTTTGCFVTKNGYLLKTTTGTSFSALTITSAGGTIVNISAIEPQGSDWFCTVTLQGTPNYDVILLVNNSTGVATPQTILGGEYESVSYYSPTEGVAAGADGNLVRLYTPLTGTAHTQIMKTSGIKGRILEAYFVNADRGIVRAMDGALASVYFTYNAGESWTRVSGNYNSLSLNSQSANLLVVSAATGTGITKRFVMSPAGIFDEIDHTSLTPQSLDIRAITSFTSGQQNFFVAGTADGKILLSNATQSNALAVTYTHIGLISGQIAKKIIARKMPSGEINILVLTQSGQLHSLFRTASGTTFTQSSLGSAFADMTLNEPVSGTSFVLLFNNSDRLLYRTIFNSTAPSAPGSLTNPGTAIPSGTVINAIAISNDRVTAVGENGALYTTQGQVTSSSTQADWTDRRGLRSLAINDITTNSYSGVSHVAAGNNGTLLKRTSTDGFWRLVQAGRLEDLNAVVSVSSGTVPVIAGSNGLLATVNLATEVSTEKTSSVGLTGSQSLNGETLYALAATGNQLYAAGKSGSLIYALDIVTGTFTFVKNNVADFRGLSIIPGQTGGEQKVIAVGSDSKIFRYRGINGMQLKQVFGPRINDVHFDGMTTGTFAATTSYLRQTTDGGQTWKVILPSVSDHNIVLNTVCTKKAPDGSHFALAGGTLYFGKVSGLVSTKINTNTVKDIEFNASHGNTGYYAYSYKVDKITLAPSVNTYGVTLAAYSTMPNTSHIVNAIHVFDNKYIMAAGALSSVYYIPDGGVSPALMNTGLLTNINLNDVYFHDNSVGYVAGYNSGLAQGYVYRFKTTSFVGSSNVISAYQWTEKNMTDVIATSGNTNINVSCIAFGSRYDGLFGGSYNGALNNTAITPYVRRIHDESGEFTARFFYDRLGRIVVSQNSRQYADGGNTSKFSYTIYDPLGRVTEAGEKTDDQNGFASIFGTSVNNLTVADVVDDGKLKIWLDNNFMTTRKEVTKSYYDKTNTTVATGLTTATGVTLNPATQRKRIIHVTYEENYDNSDLTFDHAMHYDYDIHGNVKTLIQDNKLMAAVSDISANRYKVLNYNYDLISGNVHRVDYQTGKTDQWHHAYSYDADNRITDVFTTNYTPLSNPAYGQASSQNEPGLTSYWDKEAEYAYYEHGPLARTELGKEKVQGIDYIYTLQGWIKDVNSNQLIPRKDPGEDGSTAHPHVATDVYGYSLHYFAGDYASVGGVDSYIGNQTPSCGLTLNASNLYNGNIARMVTTITNPTTRAVLPLGNAYRYDQLNRIKQSRSYTGLNFTTNNWSTGEAEKYENTFTYDANGNIMTQTRANSGGTMIDNLQYRYKEDLSGKKMQNRLYHVDDDPLISGSFSDDIDDFGTFVSGTDINTANKYSYDREGRLTRDLNEEIASIQWRVDGKVKSITRTAGSSKKNLKFDYDAMGRRIAKHVYTGTTLLRSTYYVLDAQGNVMSVYKRVVNSSSASVSYRQTERHIYGSDRLGIMKADVDLLGSVSMTAVKNTVKHTIGLRSYELKNHLGNVLSVITDRPIPQITNNFYGKFDGSNDYVGTSASFGLGTTNTGATIELWARTSYSSGVARVIGGQQSTSATKTMYLSVQNGKPQVSGKSGTTTLQSSGQGTTTMSDGQWHHVAGTYDGSYWKVYLDGVLQSTSGLNTGNLQSVSLPFYVGCLSTGQYFPGDVREVAYWDHARTATQIAADKTATDIGGAGLSVTSALKGYWKFENTAGIPTNVKDYASSPHDGTMTNGTYYGNDAAVNATLADIRQSSDYSPFGVTLDNRNFSTAPTTETLNIPSVVYSCDFEQAADATTLGGWSIIGSAGEVVTTFSSSKRLRTISNTAGSGSHQYFAVTAGLSYTFTFTLNTSAAISLRLSSATSSGGTLTTVSTASYNTGTYSITFTPTTAYIDLSFLRTATFYLDDLSLTKVTPTLVTAETQDYAYGFQGQEEDDDLKGEGNSVNFEFRMYDSRIGRFFAIDPLTAKYPHYTPYSFSGNKVIFCRELEGAEEVVAIVDGDVMTLVWDIKARGRNEGGTIMYVNKAGDILEAMRPMNDQEKALDWVSKRLEATSANSTHIEGGTNLSGGRPSTQLHKPGGGYLGEGTAEVFKPSAPEKDELPIEKKSSSTTGRTSGGDKSEKEDKKEDKPGSSIVDSRMYVYDDNGPRPFSDPSFTMSSAGKQSLKILKDGLVSLQNSAPEGYNRVITSVNVNINSKMSSAQQSAIKSAIGNSIYGTKVNFVSKDLGAYYRIGKSIVNYTDKPK